jgi:hypothetical protein
MNAPPFPNAPPYLPGSAPDAHAPLARFLPPVPVGAATRWLAAHAPPGAWVLEPFGASPALVLEMARAGWRVLIAANNPIARFLIETRAAPPAADDLRAALAALAAARTGDERLEPHLLALYHTPCAQCGALISADEFLWEQDAPAPFARLYRCPRCGQGGQFPATPFDAEQAARAAATPLHRARALERVAPLHDPDRAHAEEALRHYTPRTVYALFAIINKLDALTPSQQAHLAPLLLHTFDRTNTLWGYPEERPRPRQLTVPPQYRERNVFREVEAALEVWAQPADAPVPLTRYPQLPPQTGGICLFDGALRSLAPHLTDIPIAAVAAAAPRPNQAYWTLSALWAGWLWGHTAVEPFKSALRRQRYDWRWHTAALHAAFEHLALHIPPGTPTLTLIPEAEPGLLAAALIAGRLAGLHLQGIALRADEEQAQIHWTTSPPADPPASQPAHPARAHLLARGEPAPYLPLLAASLASLPLPDAPPADAYARLTSQLEESLTFRGGFLRLGGGKALETGHWWLRQASPAAHPLADRVESAVAALLENQPGQTARQIETAICAAFPGLLTPERALIAACLESYGEQSEDGGWTLRPEDDPVPRKNEENHIRGLLLALGERLGFTVQGGSPITWAGHGRAYCFFVTTSARLGAIVHQHDPATLVLPGSRAQLVLLKRRRDPRLAAALRDWRFIKFRLVRRLAAGPLPAVDALDEQFALDALTEESPQMRMW